MTYKLAEDYLPHSQPMVMIKTVDFIDHENCICKVDITKEDILSPFLDSDFNLPNAYAIELMAQTIGVWNGYHAQNSDIKSKIGMLLGGRNIKFNMKNFPLNSTLTICAKLILSDKKLASFDCKITIDNEIVAYGRLNVYEPTTNELKTLIEK